MSILHIAALAALLDLERPGRRVGQSRKQPSCSRRASCAGLGNALPPRRGAPDASGSEED